MRLTLQIHDAIMACRVCTRMTACRAFRAWITQLSGLQFPDKTGHWKGACQAFCLRAKGLPPLKPAGPSCKSWPAVGINYLCWLCLATSASDPSALKVCSWPGILTLRMHNARRWSEKKCAKAVTKLSHVVYLVWKLSIKSILLHNSYWGGFWLRWTSVEFPPSEAYPKALNISFSAFRWGSWMDLWGTLQTLIPPPMHESSVYRQQLCSLSELHKQPVRLSCMQRWQAVRRIGMKYEATVYRRVAENL